MLKQIVILLAVVVVVTLGLAIFLYTSMNPAEVTGGATGTPQQTADLSKADINGDGKVNVLDMSIIGRNMGKTRNDPSWDPRADTNGDGVVTQADYTAVMNYYRKG